MWSDIQSKVTGEVFAALLSAEFDWAVIGNYEGLPRHNPTKDIDLIIDKHQIDDAMRLIVDVMKSNEFTFHSQRRFESMYCCEFFMVSEDRTESIKVDVLYGFVWRGATLVDISDVSRFSSVYNGFPVPNELLNGFLLWIKPLITGAGIKSKYEGKIMQAVTDNPDLFHKLLKEKVGISLGDELWDLMKIGKLQETVRYMPKIRSGVWVTAFRKRPFSTMQATIEHTYRTIRLRLNRGPASFFAIVGPDGVGKTTFITLLRKELARVLVKDEDAICLQHFRPHLLPNIKQLMSGGQYNPAGEEFNRPHRATPVGAVSSLVRLSYYWTDYVAGYWVRIRHHCAGSRGGIYIFDRYFYDFVVDPRRSRLGLPKWVRKLFLQLTPQPDIVFFLDCDADTVYARKQELSRDEIARQLEVYRDIAEANPQRFVCLDASQFPEVSCQRAIRSLVTRSFRAL